MTIFKYYGKIEKLLHQNQAEYREIIEGCLIDNYLVQTRRGYMAILETYVNCWTSCYTVYFSTNPHQINEVWDKLTAGLDNE